MHWRESKVWYTRDGVDIGLTGRPIDNRWQHFRNLKTQQKSHNGGIDPRGKGVISPIPEIKKYWGESIFSRVKFLNAYGLFYAQNASDPGPHWGA